MWNQDERKTKHLLFSRPAPVWQQRGDHGTLQYAMIGSGRLGSFCGTPNTD